MADPPAWGKLRLVAAQEEDSDVYFTVRDAETNQSVGEAFVNLERLLKTGVDRASEALQVLGLAQDAESRNSLVMRS